MEKSRKILFLADGKCPHWIDQVLNELCTGPPLYLIIYRILISLKLRPNGMSPGINLRMAVTHVM